MSSKSMAPGALLIYHEKTAKLTGVSGTKYDISVEGGSAKSVRLKDFEFLHPGPVTQLPPPEPGKPDIEGVLELIGTEGVSFADFVELLYSETGPGAYYGAWKILREGTYFNGSMESGVQAKPQEEIQRILQAAREKEEAKARHAALLERIRSGKLADEDRPAMAEIEQVAYGINSASRLLHELGIEAVPEKAHALLLKLGVWDETVNPYPARAGIVLKNPDDPVPSLPEEPREDLTRMPAYAIDNEGSNDPDDAISFEDGLLWVHVADPAAVVTPDSPLDLAARANGENLYLPEQVLHMLPPGMTDTFGLGLHETSPALSFALKIAEDGSAELERMTLSTVRVERLTYETAREKMEQEDFRQMREALSWFRDRRAAKGALFIRMPEIDLHVRDGRVEIVPVEMTPERELVANAMLAAGAAVGKYAADHEIAMPFAAQSKAEGVPENTGSLSCMYQTRKCCTPGYGTTLPEPHAGLGLDAYVRVTSPLRRYADLLAHQQIRKLLAGEEPFTVDDLDARFPEAEKEAVLRKKTERISNEFWTLVYLKQNPDWHGTAIVADHPDERTAFIIPELAYEFKVRFGGELPLNKSVDVSLSTLDLPLLLPHFKIS